MIGAEMGNMIETNNRALFAPSSSAGYARLKERLCHEQVPSGNGTGQYDCPRRIDHAEVADNVVEGNKTAAEEHRDREENHPEFP